MMTHYYFTGTYSVKSGCSGIGVPFTRSKKAEAENIFISTFSFRSTLSNFDFEALLKISNSIRFCFNFFLTIPKRRVFATFAIYFKSN